MEPQRYENILCPYDCTHNHEHSIERLGASSGASSGTYSGGSSSGGSYNGNYSGAMYGARGYPGTGRSYAYNGARQSEEQSEYGQSRYGQQENSGQNMQQGMPQTIFVEAHMPPKHDSMKEQSTGSPIINMVPGGERSGNGDAFGGMGALAGILPLALLAPLLGLGRNGFGGNGGEGRNFEAVIAEQIGDVRHDIGESAVAALKESFAADKDALRAGFAAEIASVKAGLEAKLETERAVNQIDGKISCLSQETEKGFCRIEKDIDDKFCCLKDEMLKGFAVIKEREILDELRLERERNAQLHETIRDRALLTDILTAFGVVTPTVPIGGFAKKA